MHNTILKKHNSLTFFFVKNQITKKKWIWDFKKYLVKSWKTGKENISENIDNFLYK